MRVSSTVLRVPKDCDWPRTRVDPAPVRVTGVVAVAPEAVPSSESVAPLLTFNAVYPVLLPVITMLPPLTVSELA